MTQLDPVHPGEVLRHDFMEPVRAIVHCLGEGGRGNSGAHQRDRALSARHHGRDGPAPHTLFRNGRRELDEPPASLRAHAAGTADWRGVVRHEGPEVADKMNVEPSFGSQLDA